MKFWIAMTSYAVLAVIAAFWIDGKLRTAVWIPLAGLTLKTLVARKIG